MSRITLDDSLHTKLGTLRETVEVCDLKGKRVGYFLPEQVLSEISAAKAQCPLTVEQLSEARTQRSGTPLAEIWDRLRKSGLEIP